jgi:hypothetical protein
MKSKKIINRQRDQKKIFNSQSYLKYQNKMNKINKK